MVLWEKLHLLAQKISKKLPFSQYLGVSPASCADLTVMKPVLENLHNITVVLDKAYCDRALEKQMLYNNTEWVSQIKSKKNETPIEKQQNRSYNEAIGTAVAKIRHPVKSFFNWIHQKTNIQDTSKVRNRIKVTCIW